MDNNKWVRKLRILRTNYVLKSGSFNITLQAGEQHVRKCAVQHIYKSAR